MSVFYHSAFIPLQHSAFIGIGNGDEMPVVIDSGASSQSLSPFHSDFITLLHLLILKSLVLELKLLLKVLKWFNGRLQILQNYRLFIVG